MNRTPSPARSSKSPATKSHPRPPKVSVPSKKPAPRITQKPSPATKQAQLIAALGSASGATLAQMMKLTGWQPHTVRGMLSGSLRKRLGLNVQQQVEEGVRVYRIVKESAA